MKKNRMFQTLLLSTVLSLLAVVLLTSTVSAHSAVSAHAVATGQVPDIANVNIITTQGKAVFSPTVVHCNAHDLTAPCFTLTNTTNVSQQLIIQGHNSLILGPGVYVRFFVGPGVVSYSLKSNRHAHLTALSS